MKQRQKKEEGGADWMGTYGDMVTLLLCFFVLLYSISSVDQVKWENLVRSLNPDAEEVSQIVTSDLQESGEEDVPGSNQASAEETFEEIYDNLLELKAENQLMADVQIASGDGYHFITFNDSVFFDGDSYVLRAEGREILDLFVGAISSSAESINEMHILGHTSQAYANIPNDVAIDRLLSASRAAEVTAYIQNKNVIEGAQLISTGYGQFRPIDTFETAEGRAKNRRVEIIITQAEAVERSLEEYYDLVYGDDTPDTQSGAESTAPTEGTQAAEGTPTTDATTTDAPTTEGTQVTEGATQTQPEVAA